MTNPPTTSYDSMLFSSEEEATEAGELYTIKYKHPLMIITDPEGQMNTRPLNFKPTFGLDVSDWHTLKQFLDKDMTRRADL